MKQEGPSPAPAACGVPHGTLLDGQASAGLAGKRVGIVVSRYNPRVTEPLLEGAARVLLGAGLAVDRLVVARVPGAFELPLAADRLAAAGGFDAILCLGAIIRGETTHDRHIADAVAGGIEAVARARGIPVVFGVLTCQTLEQAAQYAVISLDSTMRSNVAVGPPIDLLVYGNDEFSVRRYRRLEAADPDLMEIRSSWEQALRKAIATLPRIDFAEGPREQQGVAFTRGA